MNYVLIIHEVEDYAQWKGGFDKASGIRKAAGEISYQVLRYEAGQNLQFLARPSTSGISSRLGFQAGKLYVIYDYFSERAQ